MWGAQVCGSADAEDSKSGSVQSVIVCHHCNIFLLPEKN